MILINQFYMYYSQIVGHDTTIEQDIRFSEEFEVFSDEFDSMSAIYPHDIRFHFGFITPVYL